MLEVIGLTKVYSSKKGAEVRALDGVTLKFPEKGMVFLLGKSGSGKSTLLNVCGGLDAPTGGEIIVKGRSSKDFSQSDFDSYRNTFIGFIFQEYNILNEFSVEDNIALALELQGKPKDKAAVEALLREVDLVGFAKRKPNTLSGGQKQRIAIARALVKSPEIIMADEPTGALDSNTGRQVFETLKKLSRDKLVIVVSHDRDFAEQYGDRVIELSDGKVLTDVTKSQIESQSLTENVNTVGDVLCVKSGSSLTDGDFEKIKAFLKNTAGDLIIANNKKDIDGFKKVSRISEDGAKEVFVDTDESRLPKKQYTKEDSRFIRSKLPLRHAIKIGMSSLGSKPVRLTFTVLLCTVAFVLFGLLSTLSFYDSDATFRQTMQDAGSTMKVGKNYKVESTWYTAGGDKSSYISAYETRFSDSEVESMRADFGADVFGSVPVSVSLNTRSTVSSYYVNKINDIAYLPEGNSLRGAINGTYPEGEKEIVLTEYLADVLFACKTYTSDGKPLELTSRDELIGKTLSIAGTDYKVTGIINVGEIPAEYAVLVDGQTVDERLTAQFMSYLNDSMNQMAFVSEARLKTIARDNPVYVPNNYMEHRMVAVITKGAPKFPEWSNAQYMPYSEINKNYAYTSASGKTEPTDNEVIVTETVLCNLINEALSPILSEGTENQDYYDLSMLIGELYSKGTHKEINGKTELVPFTAAELDARRAKFMPLIKKCGIPLKLTTKLFNSSQNSAIGEVITYDIIGFATYPTDNDAADYIFVSEATNKKLWDEQKRTLDYYEEIYTEYEIDKEAIYGKLFLPYDGSEEQTEKYLKMYKNEDFSADSSRVDLMGSFIENIKMVDGLVKSLSKAFLYVGIVLAVFAALLFSNFISVSISQKKREIGILRAVGARSADVFKIFFSESFFIALVCVVLSTIGSVIICGYLNAEFATGIGASLFVFGPLSFGVLILIAFLTVVAATFIPVNTAAKKKPVDSIRAL